MAGGPEGGGSRRLEARSDPDDPPFEGAHILERRRGGERVPQIHADLRHPVQRDQTGGRLRTLPDGVEDLVPIYDSVAVDDAHSLARAVPREEPEGDPPAGPLDGGDEGEAGAEEPGDGRGQG